MKYVWVNLSLAKRRHTKHRVPLNPAAYLPTPAFLWTKGGFFDESVPTYPFLYGRHAVLRYLPRISVGPWRVELTRSARQNIGRKKEDGEKKNSRASILLSLSGTPNALTKCRRTHAQAGARVALVLPSLPADQQPFRPI